MSPFFARTRQYFFQEFHYMPSCHIVTIFLYYCKFCKQGIVTVPSGCLELCSVYRRHIRNLAGSWHWVGGCSRYLLK